MNKITIIGAGSVGSTIAYTLAAKGMASEIVLIDINHEKALGEAMDIRQGLPFCSPCSIYQGDYSDAKGSNIVIVTSGMARKPGMTRLDLAQVNVDITKSFIPDIIRHAPEAHYIIVSNPVDILTYVFTKYSGLREEQIIGSGTILDTARLRSRISELYQISQQNVHAYVLGEHGDSAFVPWSVANISNVAIEDYRNSIISGDHMYPEFNKDDILEYVRKSGASVIQRKGATFYAVSLSVCHIVKCLLGGIDTTLTVSTMLHGEYGIDDVCLSLLSIVGADGAHSKVTLKLTDDEIKALHNSADCLKNIIKNINI